MKYLIRKISAYNIFNYLLPGVLFVALGEMATSYQLVHSDWFLGVFLYYFVGLCISRVGSFLIEPALRRTGFLHFAPYEDYVRASNSDTKLEILSEQNNMYRTLCSLCILLILLKAYEAAKDLVPLTAQWFILLLALLVLFLFSYRKATQYVARRVKISLQQQEAQTDDA